MKLLKETINQRGKESKTLLQSKEKEWNGKEEQHAEGIEYFIDRLNKHCESCEWKGLEE